MTAIDPTTVDHLGARAGSQPLVLLGVLITSAALAALALVVTLRWSERTARALWSAAGPRLRSAPWLARLTDRSPVVARVARSLSSFEYLALHLAIGLVVTLSGVAFLALAYGVSRRTAILGLDHSLAASLHSSADAPTRGFFVRFTDLGGGLALTLLGVTVASWLFATRRLLLAWGFSVAMLGMGVLNTALKAAFARPRPSFGDGWVPPSGWSFPSGHAMGTWVATGMLAYVAMLVSGNRRAGWLCGGLALLWSVTMAYSRMVVGAHYLSDILGGLAAGTVWLGACISGLEISRRRPERAD